MLTLLRRDLEIEKAARLIAEEENEVLIDHLSSLRKELLDTKVSNCFIKNYNIW
jgi:hypothetical protein